MSKVIRLKKGLDIKLLGTAEKVLSSLAPADSYAVRPSDFKGLTPKLLVKVGDCVKAGTPLFFDKYRPEVLISSPISGTVTAVNRGDKRKILDVVITPDSERGYEEFNVGDYKSLSREAIIELMQKSGLWPMMIQRPYGVIADSKLQPKAIYVSMIDTAPLAPDMDFVLQNNEDNFIVGIDILKKLSSKVHLGVDLETSFKPVNSVIGVEVNTFVGPHPSGNVGVQIHHTNPISKGEVVWTINAQDLAILGRFFKSGKVDMSKIIALTGSEVKSPSYKRVITGASIKSIAGGNIKEQAEGEKVRVISGNVLTGVSVGEEGSLSFYSNQITIIPEGDKHEFVGWIAPRIDKFSVSRCYFSWLMPSKKYRLDTNLNGGERAYVMTGQYEKVLPMDIYPVYLIKAVLAGDIDKMENLGIYEVIEEDLALCEFVCTSKTEVQDILRNGINLMIKELS